MDRFLAKVEVLQAIHNADDSFQQGREESPSLVSPLSRVEFQDQPRKRKRASLKGGWWGMYGLSLTGFDEHGLFQSVLELFDNARDAYSPCADGYAIEVHVDQASSQLARILVTSTSQFSLASLHNLTTLEPCAKTDQFGSRGKYGVGLRMVALFAAQGGGMYINTRGTSYKGDEEGLFGLDLTREGDEEDLTSVGVLARGKGQCN